jgi:hypothetical protein
MSKTGLSPESHARLFRALHAEAKRRGLDHDALRDIIRSRFDVASMADAQDRQLLALYKDWTGKSIRRKSRLPKRGYTKTNQLEIISAEDLETLGNAFSLRNWGPDTIQTFVRRQLGGRDQIRTRADFHRVFSGVRAMNRRDGLLPTATKAEQS